MSVGHSLPTLISIQTSSAGIDFYEIRVQVNLLTPVGDLCYFLIIIIVVTVSSTGSLLSSSLLGVIPELMDDFDLSINV